MESRIHGDMYVRFGGGLAETYHRKVAKRCWPSLLVEIAAIADVAKTLGNRIAKRTFATTVTLMNGVPIESVSKMLGHTNIRTTQLYAKILDEKVGSDMAPLREIFASGQNSSASTKETTAPKGEQATTQAVSANQLQLFAEIGASDNRTSRDAEVVLREKYQAAV